MMSQSPQVPIEVDPETGQWSTDGLPMVYVPVHFFLNNHRAIEKELGQERYAYLLYEAGYASAWTWCEAESSTHGIAGEEVFRHYLDRLSQRGWALFKAQEVRLEDAYALVEVRHSIFTPDPAQESQDYMFTGWFSGAMDQIQSATGSLLRSASRQIQGELGERSALFEVTSVEPGRRENVTPE